MPIPAARMLRLLELLQSAPMRTVAELTERLAVDERTVRRYVAKLVEQDIPIETIRGRHGGYKLGAGYRMPPLVLSDDEALAVVLGLLRAEGSDTPTLAARTALAKISRVLPVAVAHRLDRLTGTAVHAGSGAADVPDAEVLLAVADAVHRRRPLRLSYRDADAAPSQRTVHPYELVSRSGRWYLIGLDTGKRDERTFRLDRIRSARALPGGFPPPPPRDAARRLTEGFASAEYRWRVVLRIRASPEHIRGHLPETVARLDAVVGAAPRSGEPWYRAEINAQRLDWLPPVIVALDRPVRIEAPRELRALVSAAAERLLHSATGDAEN